MMNHMLVLGAGMVGIAAARELKNAGLSGKVVEARHHVGGCVHSTATSAASRVEAGAEFVLKNTGKPSEIQRLGS